MIEMTMDFIYYNNIIFTRRRSVNRYGWRKVLRTHVDTITNYNNNNEYYRMTVGRLLGTITLAFCEINEK